MKKKKEMVRGFNSFEEVPSNYTGIAVVRSEDKEPLVTSEHDSNWEEIGSEKSTEKRVITAEYKNGKLDGYKITEITEHIITESLGEVSENDEKVVIIEPYENGVINGDVRIYKNGTLIKIVPYENGKEADRVEVLTDLYGRKTIMPIKDGNFDGVAETYDEEGKLVRETVWSDHIPIYAKDYENGELYYDGKYVPMSEEEKNNPISMKDKLNLAKEHVRKSLEQNKKMTDDIKSGMAKTREKGYVVSRGKSTKMNNGGR